MKKIFLWYLIMVCAGCSYGARRIRDFVDDPRSLLQDPHYAAYQQQSDALEHTYLQQEISYAEYLQRKKNLDEQYEKEVREREDMITNAGLP